MYFYVKCGYSVPKIHFLIFIAMVYNATTAHSYIHAEGRGVSELYQAQCCQIGRVAAQLGFF